MNAPDAGSGERRGDDRGRDGRGGPAGGRDRKGGPHGTGGRGARRTEGRSSSGGGPGGGRGRGPRDDDRSGTSGLGERTPGAAKEPIGRDRARTRGGAPPRRAAGPSAPPRPDLPTDEKPQLPKGVQREIERVLGKGRRSDDVALALSIGAAAIDEERPDVALEVLAWAKHEASRVPAVREAYGVALYLGEDYAAALTELQAYRRLTGRTDQNHLVADCFRALGRGLDKVADAAEALLDDEQAPEDRRAEAVLVWAGALADDGDVAAARAVVRRFLERRRPGDAEHDLRVRYLAADLAERDRDRAEVRRQLESIAAVDPGFLDVRDRLDGLRAVEG
jgi:hypothetical protein